MEATVKVSYHYSTSNQNRCYQELGLDSRGELSPYELVTSLGMRLRKAMGDTEILSRNYWGGEFRVPTFRAYAECLDHDPWTVLNEDGRPYKVVPYNETYDGWTEGFKQNKQRSGFMAGALSPYEYAYEYWEKFRMNEYHPDLFQNGICKFTIHLLIGLPVGRQKGGTRIGNMTERP